VILGIVLVADIMDLLDSTITTIAAPTIAARLHGGADLIKWLGASYALSLGVLLVTGGRLGDKYGRRPAARRRAHRANLLGLGWRSMFLINIVLGTGGLIAGLRLLPRDSGDPATAIDGPGSALLLATMLGLLFGLIQGSSNGWTALPVGALAAGVACFAAFCQRQRTAAAPLIKPSLLHNRGFTSGLILGVVFFATVGGLVYAASLFLQRGLGYSPLRAAVVGFAPVAIGIASVAGMSLITRLGGTLSLAGIITTVGGAGWLLAIVLTSGTSATALTVTPAMIVIGIGMGATFSSLYDITIGDIDPAEAGSASGSLSAIQQLALLPRQPQPSGVGGDSR
jgi:MFS family permease